MDTYGPKLSMALFASFMFSLFLIQHKVACQDSTLATEQKQALFKFISAVRKPAVVNWDMSTDVCLHWRGVICDPTMNYVISLRLPGMSLKGQIPPDSIGNLANLTSLSLRYNGLSGPIPPDFTRLKNLVKFWLQNNNFSGQLPPINMMETDIRNFNVSNNDLSGAIPSSLSKFDYSSFTGNPELCGPPLDNPCPKGTEPTPDSSTENEPKTKFPKGGIIGIAVGSPLLLLILLSCLRKDINLQPHAQIPESVLQIPLTNDVLTEGERNKLVFLEDGIYSFGLEDLLHASKEVLGGGRIGTTYKALMKEGAVVVVKRLIDVVLTKEDFESRMEILGKVKNENMVPLRAYYYSEVEKLLVYDYFPAGSVYDLLHGSRGSGQIPLDWEERMGIALSAAKGLAYLHVSEKLVHGNFKSSNIFLRQETNKEAFVSDYGLNVFFERSNSPTVTMKSDVYSFGIFLLELLTCKVPNQTSSGEEGFDLPRLVQSVPQEEWKTKVFDMELIRHQNRNVDEEMVRLLEIAMLCVSFVPNQQPTMDEVVRMIKDMNQDTPSIVTR